MERHLIVELAGQLFNAGLSLGEISKEIKKKTGESFSKTTLFRWEKKNGWVRSEERINQTEKKVALRSAVLSADFDSLVQKIDDAGRLIASVALDSIDGVAIAQQKITATIKSFPEELSPQQINQFGTLLRAQAENTKALDAAWRSFEVAGRIADFMRENVTIDIEFAEYDSSELVK